MRARDGGRWVPVTAPEPPAVWWSPRHGLIEASDDPPGYVREPAAPMYWRELPADAVRLVPAAGLSGSVAALLRRCGQIEAMGPPASANRLATREIRALLAPVPETQETDR